MSTEALEVWLEASVTVFMESTGRYVAHVRFRDSTTVRVGRGAVSRDAIIDALIPGGKV